MRYSLTFIATKKTSVPYKIDIFLHRESSSISRVESANLSDTGRCSRKYLDYSSKSYVIFFTRAGYLRASNGIRFLLQSAILLQAEKRGLYYFTFARSFSNNTDFNILLFLTLRARIYCCRTTWPILIFFSRCISDNLFRRHPTWRSLKPTTFRLQCPSMVHFLPFVFTLPALCHYNRGPATYCTRSSFLFRSYFPLTFHYS